MSFYINNSVASSFWTVGLGTAKTSRKTKNILNGLTQDSSHRIFFVFFGFPRVFGQLGLGQQKPREKPNKPKKTILNGLTQDSSHRIVFFWFFWFFWFPRVFGQLGLGQQKPQEKPNKPKKTILNGLTQDSSHRVVFLFFLFFFVFLEFLDSWAWDSKNLEKNEINQKKPKKTS